MVKLVKAQHLKCCGMISLWVRVPLLAPNLRISYNGITSDFQSDDVSSILIIRSNLIYSVQLSLVERLLWEQNVVGSNPAAETGGVAEWFNAPVLKTGSRSGDSQVQILSPPLLIQLSRQSTSLVMRTSAVRFRQSAPRPCSSMVSSSPLIRERLPVQIWSGSPN